MEVHIVVKGDTLWKIARQYGIPFEDLKRVNAHLANPDYIVPGMKIFLPKKHHNAGQQGTKGDKKEQVKHPEKGKGQVPAPPKTEVKPMPTGTLPLPKAPTPVPIPVTLPPTQIESPLTAPPVPPAQMPMQVQVQMQTQTQTQTQMPTQMPSQCQRRANAMMPMPMPMPMPVQSYPMSPCMQPLIGIPCGWMPIYDADCYPFMHSGQIQAMQSPEVPCTAPPPMQMPLQPTQFPMPELEIANPPCSETRMDFEESPLIEGWKLIESPELMTTESPGFVMPPAAAYPVEQPVAPAFMFDESPDYDLQPPVPCPPEQSYIPQLISPTAQPQYNPAQFGYPAMQQPSPPPGCGCGCPDVMTATAPLSSSPTTTVSPANDASALLRAAMWMPYMHATSNTKWYAGSLQRTELVWSVLKGLWCRTGN